MGWQIKHALQGIAMTTERPKAFRGTPIDYRSRSESDHEEWNKYCRAAFRGAPREGIFRPRYYGRWFPLPSKLKHLQGLVNHARHWLFSNCWHLSAFGMAGKGRNAPLRRNYQTRFARASRWWNSLRSRTMLAMHQSLYPRRRKWKNVEDVPELVLCYALCMAYLSQPEGRRSAVKARQTARRWMAEAIDASERGMMINAWGELEPMPNASPSAPTLPSD